MLWTNVGERATRTIARIARWGGLAVVAGFTVALPTADAADDPAPDQATIDCAEATLGHDYSGSSFTLHADAASIWATCAIGGFEAVDRHLRDLLGRLEPDSPSARYTKEAIKKVKRSQTAFALVVDAAQEMQTGPGAERGAKLMRRMHLQVFQRGVPSLASHRESYGHLARGSAAFRAAVEHSIDGRLAAFDAIESDNLGKLVKKGLAYATLAAGVIVELDAIEFGVLEAYNTLGAIDTSNETKTERRARRLLGRTLLKQVKAYHKGIKLLVKLDAKLAKLVAKALDKASVDPVDPDDPCTAKGYLRYRLDDGVTQSIAFAPFLGDPEWLGSLTNNFGPSFRVEGATPSLDAPIRRLSFAYFSRPSESDIETGIYNVDVRVVDPSFPGHPTGPLFNGTLAGDGWKGTGAVTLEVARPHPTPESGGQISGTFYFEFRIDSVLHTVEGEFSACN